MSDSCLTGPVVLHVNVKLRRLIYLIALKLSPFPDRINGRHYRQNLTSKHGTFAQRWANARPTSVTVARH